MNRNKSIINSLPIQGFNLVLDRLGLEKAWYSVLATHLNNLNRNDLRYILDGEDFKNVEVQDFDFLDCLSVGEISVLYEYSLAYMDRDKRKQEGQYFTPDDVAQVMAKKRLLSQKIKYGSTHVPALEIYLFGLLTIKKIKKVF